jgi:hypothetical protein
MPTLTDQGSTLTGEGTGSPPIDDFDGFLAAASLLRNPRQARSYVYICYYGPTTVKELVDALDLARATAYDDIEELESLGLVTRDEGSRPHQLTAAPFAFVDQGSLAITPTVLHAVALTEVDDDLAYFQNRYGTARLVRALHMAGEHYAGNRTQRMAADELDVAPAEGMAVVQALQPVLAAGTEFDPYFDHLFPEIAEEIDVRIDTTSPPRSQGDAEKSPEDDG